MLKKGFTLVEVLTALAIFIIGMGSIYFIFTKFADFMRTRTIITCVTQAAYYAYDICSSGINPPSSIRCGKITVNINADGCNILMIPEENCREISIEASFRDKSYTIRGKKCNVGG